MANTENEISQLLIAVVQGQDSDQVSQVLGENGHTFTRLPSAGGFLRERNVTFLIGCSPSTHEAIENLLMTTAQKRISYISAPIDTTPLPIPLPAETIIGGVSLFTLDVEHYEEI